MAYLLKAGIGGVLFLGSVAVFNVQLHELLQTGTCASGGPYVSARPCPEGTGTDVLLLVGSIFTGFLGAGVFVARGTPPWRTEKGRVRRGIGDGLALWTLFFGVTGGVMLVGSLTNDDLPDDGKLGGLIVGVTFLLMALPPLAYIVWSFVSSLRDPKPDERFQPSQATVRPAPQRPRSGREWITTPPAPSPTSAPKSGADPIAQLERLQKLREAGALTEAEFLTQKQRILGD